MLLNILILLNKLDSYQNKYCYFCPRKTKVKAFAEQKQSVYLFSGCVGCESFPLIPQIISPKRV